MPTNEILVNGKAYRLEASVIRDPKLQFTALSKRTDTRFVVLHQTGGEGGGSQVFNVLKERNLSVQFTIDQSGTIFQYCDAQLRCSHAGSVNSHSIGIEISNRANEEAVHDKWPRTLASTTVRGKAVKYADFYPAQYNAAYTLTKKLCEVYGLPFEAPMEGSKVSDKTLTSKYINDFKGFLGHYHLTDRKVDPFPKLLQYLVDHK